jgi:hypothetical protein
MDTVAARVSVQVITAFHRPSQAFEINKAGPRGGFYESLKVCNSNLYGQQQCSALRHLEISYCHIGALLL